MKDEVITELARKGGAVLSIAELNELGCGADWVRRRVRQGWLTRLHRGVYLVGTAYPTRAQRNRAAVLACGPASALTGMSAAEAYGLVQLPWDYEVQLAAPNRRRVGSGLDCVARDLLPHEVTTRRGVPTVTVPAMLGELARRYNDLERIVHEAEVRKLLNLHALARWIDEHPRSHGLSVLREALGARRELTSSVRSTLEVAFHEFLAWGGFPETEHNVLFQTAWGFRTVDVLFRKQWVAVEVDGSPHMSTRNFHEDRERDREFAADFDLPVLRVTARDLQGADRERLACQLWSVLSIKDATLEVPARFQVS